MLVRRPTVFQGLRKILKVLSVRDVKETKKEHSTEEETLRPEIIPDD